MESFLKKNNARSLTKSKKRYSMNSTSTSTSTSKSFSNSNSLSSNSSLTSTSISPSTSITRTTASSGLALSSNVEKIIQELDMDAQQLQLDLEEEARDEEPRVQKAYKLLQCVNCRAKHFQPVEVAEVPLAAKYQTKSLSARWNDDEAGKEANKKDGYLCISCSIGLQIKQEKYEGITDTPLYTS